MLSEEAFNQKARMIFSTKTPNKPARIASGCHKTLLTKKQSQTVTKLELTKAITHKHMTNYVKRA